MAESARKGVPLPGLHMQKCPDLAVFRHDPAPKRKQRQSIGKTGWGCAKRVCKAGIWQGGALFSIKRFIWVMGWCRQAWHHKPNGALHIIKAWRGPRPFMEGRLPLASNHGAIRAGRAFGWHREVRKKRRQMREAIPQRGGNP